jgi:uncharacterized protein YcfL
MKKLLILSVFLISLCLWGCESSVVPDPSTSIQFAVLQSAYVKLTVENSYHTVISVVVDGRLEAGLYKVSTDSLNLPEGIYFYTLEVNGDHGYHTKNTYPMLLVK